MHFVFEQDKAFKKCPFKVTLDAQKPMQMVVNLQLINEILRTLTIALKNEKLDFHYFTSKATDQIN